MCAGLLGCETGEVIQGLVVLTPEELLERNDVVAGCELQYSQEITRLGKISYMDYDYDYYLMEYVFSPRLQFKTGETDSLIFLWYLSSLCRQTGLRGDLDVTPPFVRLIYGRQLAGADSVINLIRPWINCSVYDYIPMYKQREVGLFDVDELVHLIFDRLMAVEGLEERFERDSSKGVVIYASDFLYGTNQSYTDGELTLRKSGSEGYRTVTSSEYLDELSKRSK